VFYQEKGMVGRKWLLKFTVVADQVDALVISAPLPPTSQEDGQMSLIYSLSEPEYGKGCRPDFNCWAEFDINSSNQIGLFIQLLIFPNN